MGKPVDSRASKKQDLPKYMCLNGNTQYELAQSIDAAMANAENLVKADQEQEALFLWYEQILDGIHEHFLLQKNVKTVLDNQALVMTFESLLPLCWTYYRSSVQSAEEVGAGYEARQKAGFKALMAGLLEHGFMNALDILHARNLWRFDIQRNMQQIQGQLTDAVESFISRA